MHTGTTDTAIRDCLSRIESMLGWGDSDAWSTRDFETLSERIREKTQVQLSVVTLKRVWGKIKYDSKPTITTLDALSQYAGYANWRTFKQSLEKPENSDTPLNPLPISPPTKRQKRYATWIVLLIVFVSCTGVLVYFTAFKPTAPLPDPAKFTFSSKKVVDAGVPNTVIFDYDARAALSEDSIVIQQSWDPKLTALVSRERQQHTSIYYHPGFFDARLMVNGQVVKKHNLLITSHGWLPLIDAKPVPIYFKPTDIFQNGYIQLPLDKIKASVPLQPDTPWTGYYNVGDFGDITSKDFVFETEFKNDFGEGSAACRHTELHVLFEGAAMVLPLSVPGCVSELDFGDMSGKERDLSVLGVDFSKWVNVRFTVQDSIAQLFVNDKKAFDMKITIKPVRWVGMIFKFQGTGSVNFVRVSQKKGEVVYEDNFDGVTMPSKQLQ